MSEKTAKKQRKPKFRRVYTNKTIPTGLTLCEADLMEMKAFGVPTENLKMSLELMLDISKRSYKIYNKRGQLCGVAGVQDHGCRIGMPWFLSNGKVQEESPLEFYRQAKKVLREMEKDFDILHNYCWVENTKTIDWLESLGFQFDYDNPQTFVRDDILLYNFRKVCQK